MQGPEISPSDTQALKQELARLRTKLQHSEDKDIRSALQLRIEQIQSELQAIAAKPAPQPLEQDLALDLHEELEPPSPDQLAQADRLIQQARVEKMRKNDTRATELLKEAAKVAPGSAVVLEALGDDLRGRNQFKQAIAAYRRAVSLDPKNVGLENKYAELVLQMESMGSVDDQLRRNLSDSPFLSQDETLARLPYATLLSAFVPGAGHLVLGKNTQGIFILAAWFVSTISALVIFLDMGRDRQVHSIIYLPILIAAAVYLGTLASLKGMKGTVQPKMVTKPQPPAEGGNLPFE